MNREAGTTTAAENSAAALITRRACVTTSHTSEFFWYELNFCFSLGGAAAFGRCFGRSGGRNINNSSSGPVETLPADGVQCTIMKADHWQSSLTLIQCLISNSGMCSLFSLLMKHNHINSKVTNIKWHLSRIVMKTLHTRRQKCK